MRWHHRELCARGPWLPAHLVGEGRSCHQGQGRKYSNQSRQASHCHPGRISPVAQLQSLSSRWPVLSVLGRAGWPARLGLLHRRLHTSTIDCMNRVTTSTRSTVRTNIEVRFTLHVLFASYIYCSTFGFFDWVTFFPLRSGSDS